MACGKGEAKWIGLGAGFLAMPGGFEKNYVTEPFCGSFLYTASRPPSE